MEKEKLSWIYIQGKPWLSVSSLKKIDGITMQYEKDRQRLKIYVQEKEILLLPEASHALIQGRFVRTKTPILIKRKNNLYVHLSVVEEELKSFLKEKPRLWLEKEIQEAVRRTKYALCILERPVRRIFIDPGHGGQDSGAKHRWAEEKNLVLFFSKRIKKELEKNGFLVRLSRSTDKYIPLKERPEMARKWGADVFISIHANSSPLEQIRGVETYILSEKATDAQARKLAWRENRNVGGERKEEQSTLKNILWDVKQRAYLQDSAYLASHIQSSIWGLARNYLSQDKGAWKNRGVREAPFLVLSLSSMPSILLELAYLSNPEDRKLLWNKNFQKLLAKGLLEGVKGYAKHCEGKEGKNRNGPDKRKKNRIYKKI